MEVYYPYSQYLKDKYGEKVYKLPIKLQLTCPNRDGRVGYGGCIFCNEKGGSFENLSDCLSVAEQIKKNRNYIKKRYGAKKFIAYFQNFSNTYLPFDDFCAYLQEAAQEDVVAVQISTRPDVIHKNHLDFLKELGKKYSIDVVFEIGLQTINHKTLKIMNRGHGLADSINSILKIKSYGFETCVHMMLGLPWDTMEDVIEGAKLLTVLEVDQVKIHSLYIPKNTKLAKMYERGEFQLKSMEEYKLEVKNFLLFLDKKIALQRLIGRMPKEETVFCNWNTSWWKIRDEIMEEMKSEGLYQGKEASFKEGILF